MALHIADPEISRLAADLAPGKYDGNRGAPLCIAPSSRGARNGSEAQSGRKGE
ncbi:MAG: hypothetical protein JO182_02445 [Acidobacteriaceae bacterium]|nr:hypothetical protein [Acidobacteriaceae bacterium]MBV9033328.1 hypothetical protein [Acidobacteriaceae bacterium]MBV9223742.1 hypothetical protein [Acidobacteriaceae bacterium]